MSIFPKEIFRASRRWADRQYTDIRYWNEPERGGHFAALEHPELFVNEVRAFVAPHRGRGALGALRGALVPVTATMVEPDYAGAFGLRALIHK
jgi:hypothetical protein